MNCTMGIDVGPSALKVGVYDCLGRELAYYSLPTKAAYVLDPQNPEWVCWDPDIIWDSVKRAISSCIAQLSGEHKLRAVAVTGMGMDGLPIGKDGNWIYPFISWHCTRTIPQYTSFVKQMGKRSIFDLTGQQCTHIHTIYRILWLRANYPGLFSRIDRWLLIEDYINFKLCGCFVTDYSMASTTSLLDYKQRTWSSEILGATGLDAKMLPELRSSGEVIGTVSHTVSTEIGLPKDLPVVLGGHDYICAAYLADIHSDDMILDMVGSWEMLISSANDIANAKRVFSAGCKIDCHVIPEEYCIVGDFVSTHMVEWFNKSYGEGVDRPLMQEQQEIAQMLALLDKSRAEQNVFFLPAICGAGSPDVDSRSRGAFVGLGQMTTKADLARAVMEGLNYQCNSVIRAINSAVRHDSTRQIVAVGEAAKQPVWMQNKADITGMVVKASSINHVPMRGAAKLAMCAFGLDERIDAGLWGLGDTFKVYEPDPGQRARHKAGYEIFQSLQPTLREINHLIDEQQADVLSANASSMASLPL